MRRGTDVDEAARVIRAGGLVAMPTETVYGLAADATQPAAIARIYAAKGRPPAHPLIVHLAEDAALADWVDAPPPMAAALAAAFWPGPLTLILRRGARLPAALSASSDTVGVRVPAHPLAQMLLAAVDRPLAAPSANRFGAVSPTTADHVVAELGAAVDYVLDGGPCWVGVESTIVDLTGARPTMLRPGGVARAELERVLQQPLVDGGADAAPAPGRLPSHYAPRAQVEAATVDDALAVARAAAARGERVAILAGAARFRTWPALPDDVRGAVLPDDVAAAARALFATLRELDGAGVDRIVAVDGWGDGLGEAITDRLARAAGPRPQEPR
ncbi:MAG: L-threonylcarbamoyladenylate synthase [Kofleriaceae bacterium]